MPNYYAPLTNRVDKLEKLHSSITVLKSAQQQKQQRIILASSTLTRRLQHGVQFVLPHNHADENSTKLRRNMIKRPTNSLWIVVLNGSITSAVSNTGALESAFKPLDPAIALHIQSNNSFSGAFMDIAKATTINKLHHELQEPMQSIHIVPQVKDILLSTSKYVDTNYISVYHMTKMKFTS